MDLSAAMSNDGLDSLSIAFSNLDSKITVNQPLIRIPFSTLLPHCFPTNESSQHLSLDSIGFGLRRKNGRTSFYPRLYVHLPFEKGRPLNFAFSYRGIYAGVTFTHQAVVPMETSPRSGIVFTLKNASRYELTKMRANSLVRRSATLECQTSSSDFCRLVLAPHLVASYALTPANLLDFRRPLKDFFDMSFCLSQQPPHNLDSLRQIWEEIQGLDFEGKVHAGRVMRPILNRIQRHGMPKVAREILRYVFYHLFPFNEIM